MEEKMTVREAAKYKGVSEQAIVRWIRSGLIQGVQRIGRMYLIPREALDAVAPRRRGRPSVLEERLQRIVREVVREELERILKANVV